MGLEVLGRLLYFTYDQEHNYFDNDKVSQLAQLDWLYSSQIWHGNIIRIEANPKDPTKAYKISATMGSVKSAVDKVKMQLGWMSPPPPQFELY